MEIGEPENRQFITAEKGKIPPDAGKFVDLTDGKIIFGSYDPKANSLRHYELISSDEQTGLATPCLNAGLVAKIEKRVWVVFGNSGELKVEDGRSLSDLPKQEKLERDNSTVERLNRIYKGEIVFKTLDQLSK